nr:Probable adenine permease PurP [Klebsiella pneumoniae]
MIGQVDLAGSLNLGLAGVIFSFMLVNLFDSSGTLIGVTDKAVSRMPTVNSRA